MQLQLSLKMILISLLLILISTACIEENVFVNRTAEFPDMLTIRNGQSVFYKKANALLRYKETIDDSRCPLNVKCDWEGIAHISIEFSLPKTGNVQFPLAIHGYVGIDNSDAHETLDTLDYTFRLAALEPYPVHPVDNNYSDYVATIIITKNLQEGR